MAQDRKSAGDSAHIVRGMVCTHERGRRETRAAGNGFRIRRLFLAALVSPLCHSHRCAPFRSERSERRNLLFLLRRRNLLLARGRLPEMRLQMKFTVHSTTTLAQSAHTPLHTRGRGGGSSSGNRKLRSPCATGGWVTSVRNGDERRDRCSGTRNRDSPSDRHGTPPADSFRQTDCYALPMAIPQSAARFTNTINV